MVYKVWAIVAINVVVLLGLLYLADTTSAVTLTSMHSMPVLFEPCNDLVTTYFKTLSLENWALDHGIVAPPTFYHHLITLEADLIYYGCMYTI